MSGAGDEAVEALSLAELVRDARQSPAALEIRRGTVRCLASLGAACLPELPLQSFRRADIAAVTAKGDIWIIEIKSSIEDFRADHKWHEYRDFCDRLWFAVSPSFPRDLIPEETGLIVADRHGGEILREAPVHRLAPSRRKATILRLARAACVRAMMGEDPQLAAELRAVRE